MSILSVNITSLRKQKKLTQQQVAAILNKTQQAYAKYENGFNEPDTKSLQILANLYNVSLDFLIGKDAESKLKGVKIPVLGCIPAGIPIEAIEDILDYEEISEELAKTGEFFALKVKGDSMLPTIKNGDIVIIKKTDDCESGKICAIMINGYDATLKEIKKEPQGIYVIPHNPNCDFKPSFYTNKEIIDKPIRVIGVAVEIRRSL